METDFQFGYEDGKAGYYDKRYRYNRKDNGAEYDRGVQKALKETGKGIDWFIPAMEVENEEELIECTVQNKLNEMATLRYPNNELVGLGEKDNLIKITINNGEMESPHFNVVIGDTVIRIDLDTLTPKDREPNWKDYLTKKQFNAIIDWASQNKNLLLDIYNNAKNTEDYKANFTKLSESINTNRKIIYDTTPAIDEVEIIDDDFIITYFKCGIAKTIWIDDLIDYNPNYFRELKNLDVLHKFKVYPHCIIWNDDLDLAGSFIWKNGEIVEEEN